MAETETFEIIQANLSNLGDILPLFHDYLLFYHQDLPSDTIRDFLSERLIQKDSLIFLSLFQQNIIGFIQLYSSFNSLTLKRLYILHDFYVIPSFRGQGIGSRLLEYVKNYVKENGNGEIMLQTSKENYNAQRLYEKHGFHVDTEFLCYYQTIG